MPIFDHPGLGKISHLVEDGVSIFRGMGYASLEHAFADPKVVTSKSNNVYDATQYGPTSPSPPEGCDMELSIIQKTLPHAEFPLSATDCLNLNLCGPQHYEGHLPVFMFFHGGGFAIGANAWPQYDLQRFIRLSIQLGKPVIGVQPNYRLGAYGFLHSQALQEAGVNANRGLRDQRAAIEWVHKHIAGFGGDPSRLTVIGQSAGGVSCTLHLQSEQPLFDQLVAMGGTSLLMKPLPSVVADMTYSGVLEKLKIDSKANAEVQLKQLLEISPTDMVSKLGGDLPLLPIIDGDLVRTPASFEQYDNAGLRYSVPGIRWCRRAMLGDCRFDGSILGYKLFPRKTTVVEAFERTMRAYLTESTEDLEKLMQGYRLDVNDAANESVTKLLNLITDMQFYAPTFIMAQAWPESSFIYHFNEPNPWDGPLKGHAGHILDVAFLFQNFNEFLDAKQRKAAEIFAADVINFVAGATPYPSRDKLGVGAQVYGPPCSSAAGFVVSSSAEDYGRSSFVWKLGSQFGWDKLSNALDMFIAGS